MLCGLVSLNFMCQLDWAKDAPISHKTLLLGLSVMLFLEEIIICLGSPGSEISSHQCL